MEKNFSDIINSKEFLAMDKLDRIFYLQNLFDTDLVKNRGLENISKDEWVQKEILALLSELAELLAEVNFKWWKNKKEVNYCNVKEEIVDILHFFTGMCLKIGMNAEELTRIYIKKNEENFNRQYGKSEKKGYELSATDIDNK